jgi:serine protease Do
MEFLMIANAPRQGFASSRRVAMLATVAVLGGAAALAGYGFAPKTAGGALFAPAYAQNAQRPVGFADIVEKVKPAVMSVRVKVEANSNAAGFDFNDDNPLRGSPFEDFFRRFAQPGPGGRPDQPGLPRQQRRQYATGQGSGFFISADGYAVTNNHVVDKAESVEVTSDDGKNYTAKVIGTDPRTDIALIKVSGRNDFPFVHFGDHSPRIGAAVNKGNSGGPTFDVDGNVIGVNTAIFSPSGGNVGIAFDIPAETVKAVVAQLRDHGAVTRGWIGVQIQPVTADIADSLGMKSSRGALVAEPQPGSPAEKAGIKAGDVIVSVNGEAVEDARTLARRISALAPGTSVKLGVLRNSREDTLTLTLGELPQERAARANVEQQDNQGTDVPRLGLSLAPAKNGGEGVVVTSVDPNGAAGDRFKNGDIILDINGKLVSSPAEVRKAVADAHAGGKRTVLMRVKSGQATRFVAVPLGNA